MLSQAMNFSKALEALKSDKAVSRVGWNGKGMFLYYVPEGEYETTTKVAKSHFGKTVKYKAYIAMKTVDGDVVPWLASQTDLIADDWQVVSV